MTSKVNDKKESCPFHQNSNPKTFGEKGNMNINLAIAMIGFILISLVFFLGLASTDFLLFNFYQSPDVGNVKTIPGEHAAAPGFVSSNGIVIDKITYQGITYVGDKEIKEFKSKLKSGELEVFKRG